MAARTTQTPSTSDPLLSRFYGTAEPTETDLAFNYQRFIRMLRRRIKKRRAVHLIIDAAETGFGKSTLGIQICRDLDPEFGLDHFAFRGSELKGVFAHIEATRKAPFSMAQLDEPKDLLSRGGRRDALIIDIATAIGAVRKNLIGCILIAPKKEWFDSLVRSGLIPYWVFVERPGVGRVHRSWKGATYKVSQRNVQYDRMGSFKIGFRNLDRDPFFRSYLDLARRTNSASFAAGNSATAGGAPSAAAAPADPLAPSGPDRTMSGGGDPPPPGTWACPVCGKACGNEANLGSHLRWKHPG